MAESESPPFPFEDERPGSPDRGPDPEGSGPPGPENPDAGGRETLEEILAVPESVPAAEDPNRTPDGRFGKGNKVGRTTGLYVECALTPAEERKVQKHRKRLREAGLPDDDAALMALVYYNAGRVMKGYTRLQSHEDLRAHFETYEKAARMLLQVLNLRLSRKVKKEEKERPTADKRLLRRLASEVES
jgi:hypothetical protein